MPSEKVKEMQSILIDIEMPQKLTNLRSVLTLLAMAKLTNDKNWKQTSEDYSRIHDLIAFINEHYPDKDGTDSKRGGYSENSRESFRKESIALFRDAEIIEDSNEASTNSGNTSYRLRSETARLFKSFGSDRWEDELSRYKRYHEAYKDKYNQLRKIDKGLSVQYGGKEFTLKRSSHNKLQKMILDEFATRFASGAELLYIGDAADRDTVKNIDRMEELGIHVFNKSALLPDIILFDNAKNRIMFIEAYDSTGEMTSMRVAKLKELCSVPENIELYFVTAFLTKKKMISKLLNIAWETHVWVAEEPDHMIHLD